jgi:hypothetical protein
MRREVENDREQRGQESVHFAELNAAVAVGIKDREGDCAGECAWQAVGIRVRGEMRDARIWVRYEEMMTM